MPTIIDILNASDVELSDVDVGALTSLFQEGVYIDAISGRSVFDVLTGDLGLGEQELEQIQTIFLNGQPVDDLEAAVVQNGDTMALSAAMPGLVGAVLRRGGFYAKLRESISVSGRSESSTKDRGVVRVKVFNLLLRVLTPLILRRGIYVRADRAAEALERDVPGDGLVRLILSSEE